jgi:glutamyl-tRNA reductase
VKKIENVRLIGIDYFERLAERNNLLKKDSAHTAEEIIAQEIDKLKKELAFRGFLPKINALKTAAEKVGSEKILYRLKSDLNAEQFSAVLNSLEKLAESEE